MCCAAVLDWIKFKNRSISAFSRSFRRILYDHIRSALIAVIYIDFVNYDEGKKSPDEHSNYVLIRKLNIHPEGNSYIFLLDFN